MTDDEHVWRENDLWPRMSGMRCAQISLALVQTVTRVTIYPVQEWHKVIGHFEDVASVLTFQLALSHYAKGI